jgi:chloramphenicol 3-O-phosphotransferase
VSGGAIVQLIGFPAAGKRTVALAMADLAAERGHRLVVVDNHLTGNPVLSVVDHRGMNPPPEVWALVYEVREIVDRAIEAHSPPDWSFVFTTVLTNEGDRDSASPDRLRRLAASREAQYLPVVLTCDVDELARRATEDGRAEQHKLVDPLVARTYATTRTLHRPAGALEIDVTTRPPEETAAVILDAARLR